MNDDSAMNTRLAELEAKLCLAEDLLETLNLTLFRQQEKIDRLEHELRSLRREVEAAQPLAAARDELPPHY